MWLAERPIVRMIIIGILFLILGTVVYAEQLPDVLLREAKHLYSRECPWERVWYDCHLVDWNGLKYMVLTKEQVPYYIIHIETHKAVWGHNWVKV